MKKEEMYEDGCPPEYGFSSIKEALEEYDSNGGWYRHCQVRAAVILTNNFSMDGGEEEYVFERYSRTLELQLEGWEKMWHYGEETEDFIKKKVESWRDEYAEEG
jgi:hypothetical protein